MQVTRQLGPPAQQPAQPPAAPPAPAAQPHTSPSKDMAVNTDMDMGGLEELVMNPDVMTPSAADPFTMQQSHAQQPLSNAGVSDGGNQQQSVYPPQQLPEASASGRSSQYGAQQQSGFPGVGTGNTGPAQQPQRQPSEPIFFQGQWFTPAPPGFTPPPPVQWQSQPVQQQQQQYGGAHQYQQGMAQQQQQDYPQQQQQLHSGYWQHQSYQQPQQQQQRQSFAGAAMPSGQSATAPGLYSGAAGPGGAGPLLTPANTAAQEQAWSPTSAYQFESPTFRNGAAHQLSPGQSGRTWSPAASDVTRLTIPATQNDAGPSQQKVGPHILSLSRAASLLFVLAVVKLFAWARSQRLYGRPSLH